MESLTLVQLRDFGIVALAILAFIVLLGNVVKTIKDWIKPGQSVAKWREDMDKSVTDSADRITKVEDGNKVIMRALIAIMRHEINGNSVDKLQIALDELNDYLIKNI